MSCFVAMGDSFSSGTEPGVPSFTDRVAARLTGWHYANLAEEGARSGDVAERQLPRALERRPELVTLVCGANDVVRTTRPQIDTFAANFEHILRRLGTAARVVTSTYPEVGELLPMRARTRERMDAGLEAVNSVVRCLSRRYGAVCLELAGHDGTRDPENFAADGFHPSDTGHRRAGQALAAALTEGAGIELEPEEVPA
jgi:lysophospholipase L1-like esterase